MEQSKTTLKGITSQYDIRLLRFHIAEKVLKDDLKKPVSIKINDHVEKKLYYLDYCPYCQLDTRKRIESEYVWKRVLNYAPCEKHRPQIYPSRHSSNILIRLSILLESHFTNTKEDETIKKELTALMPAADRSKPFVPKQASQTLIVGNIGAGKTTHSTNHKLNTDNEIVREETNKWNAESMNLITNSYESKEADINFQWFLIADTLSKFGYEYQESGIVGVLVHLIAKTLRDRYTLKDLVIFLNALSAVDWTRYNIIWINTPYKVCYNRIQKRIKKENKPYDKYITPSILKSVETAIALVLPFFNYTEVKTEYDIEEENVVEDIDDSEDSEDEDEDDDSSDEELTEDKKNDESDVRSPENIDNIMENLLDVTASVEKYTNDIQRYANVSRKADIEKIKSQISQISDISQIYPLDEDVRQTALKEIDAVAKRISSHIKESSKSAKITSRFAKLASYMSYDCMSLSGHNYDAVDEMNILLERVYSLIENLYKSNNN